MDTSSDLLVVFWASWVFILRIATGQDAGGYSNSTALHWHWKLGRILDWPAGSETILARSTYLIHL